MCMEELTINPSFLDHYMCVPVCVCLAITVTDLRTHTTASVLGH